MIHQLQIVKKQLLTMMVLLVSIVLILSKFLMLIQKDVLLVIPCKFITTVNINVFQEIKFIFQLTKIIYWQLQQCRQMIIMPKLHKKSKIILMLLFYCVKELNIQIIKNVLIVQLMNILMLKLKSVRFVMELSTKQPKFVHKKLTCIQI